MSNRCEKKNVSRVLIGSISAALSSPVLTSVGAARKVSLNLSQETMKCHSSSCFSIASVQGNAPLVTSLRWMDENGDF